ncbi:MAG TPA: VCBS repeat-containing protein [Candidatus Polarisedimenticolia bacterium]|nr:VCBS repeat-containing protein [Candidatus Polarisedimenticolia bacterium]
MPKDLRRRPFSVPHLLILAAFLVGSDAASRGAEARPFLPDPVYGVGHNPRRLAVADFDGDGRTDVAVANAGNTGDLVTVSLLLNDGGGLFRAAGVVYSSAAAASSLVILLTGDVNLDGKADLVLETGGGTSWLAHVLLGQGNGAFTPVVPNLALPGRLALDDCNADGRLDLLVRSGSGGTSQLRVWTGAGNGTFTGLAPFAAPAGIDFGASPFAVGDLNGDHIADVVAMNTLLTASVVFKGSSTGTFTQGQSLATPTPQFVSAVADVSGDGIADFIVEVEPAGFELRAWRGHGDGTFDVTPFATLTLPQSITGLAVGDLNRDGTPDLATTTGDAFGGGTKSQIWIGGGGSFAPRAPFTTGLEAVQPVIGDFDGALGFDLAVAGGAGNDVLFVLARPGGTWVPATLPSPTGLASIVDEVVADFNGDGRSDVAILHSQPSFCDEPPCPWGEVEVRLALPGGGFNLTSTTATGNNPAGSLIAADLDLDGKLDLVNVDTVDVTGPTIDPGTLSLLRGHGDGTFDPVVTLPTVQWPQDVAAGDLDHDGDIDLAVVSSLNSNVTISLRGAGGAYTAQAPIAVGRAPVQVDLADVDGDLTSDLVITTRGNGAILGELAWLRGHGDATFDPRVVLFQALNPTGSTMGDLDGDGDVDFVVSVYGENFNPAAPGGEVVLLHQPGNTFTTSSQYQAGVQPNKPRLADLNGDGVLDVYVTMDGNELDVFPGVGNGTFLPAERFAGVGCGGYWAARLVGDGDLDLFGACLDFAVFENEADQNPDLRLTDNTHLSWGPISFIGAWDVIRGSTASLRSTGGNFSTAVQACLQNDGPLHTLDVAPNPPIGDAFFYLVRAVRPNGSGGSYDGEQPGQAAPRDASIAASPVDCP